MKRAQTAMEFVILLSFMMLVFVAFFIIVQQRLISIGQEHNDKGADDALAIVLNEITLAESVSDGYYREFVMPSSINGLRYNITILTGPGSTPEIVVSYSGKEKVYFLQQNYINESSSLALGTNSIAKFNGTIYIV